MKYTWKTGITNRTIQVFLQHSTSTTGAGRAGVTATGFKAYYSRIETDNDVTVTQISTSALSALTDAHTDGGWIALDATNMPGWYRFDLPDALCAAGAIAAGLAITDSGSSSEIADNPTEIQLVAYDPEDSVRAGLTALPNAAADAAGGLPISDGGGLDMDAILVDTNSLNDTKVPDTISLANINAEVDTALVDVNLDHLVGTAAPANPPAGTYLDILADDGTATYDRTTDSLQAIRDHVGDGTNLTEAGGTGDHLTAIDLPNQTMDITGNITGNLSGSVGSVTGAVGSVTGAVGSVTGAVGSVTAQVTADVTAISGDTTAADRLEGLMDGVLICQVNDAAATTTAFAADGFTEATDDHFNGRLITFLTGALAGQQTDITDYDAADHAQGAQTFVVSALTEAPANNDFFIIH